MDVIQVSLFFWGVLLLPMVLFGLCIHACEHFIQHRLASRFGWRSILVTGWLGTPIHELSHAFMCWVFRHRIDEIRLFDPDVEDGRLGFVRHSFRRGNWFEESGNVLIGTAPLLGGSLVLVALTLLFYPQSISSVTEAIRSAAKTDGIPWQAMLDAIRDALTTTFSVANLVTPRFWIYAYLVVCVASHMAPSRSDYAGARRAMWMVGGAGFLLGCLVFALLRISPADLARSVLGFLAPVHAIALLALALVVASAVAVGLLTALFPIRFQTMQD